MKVVAPSLLEVSNEGVTDLTENQVLRLHDELLRLQEQADKGGVKPRALVKAMQQLYMMESVEEACLAYSTESADEEALRQLVERTEEFAPALTALRELAVDRDIFEHLREQIDDETGEVHESESEGSDLEQDLVGSREPAPVVLPPGWRLEWVKRKRREMKEFVDPNGTRYYNVKDVRSAIERWKTAEETAALEADLLAAATTARVAAVCREAAAAATSAGAAAEAAAAVAAEAEAKVVVNFDDLPVSRPIKRKRLKAKTSERDLGYHFPLPSGNSVPPNRARQQHKPAPSQSAGPDLLTDAFEGSLEAALEEALDGAVGSDVVDVAVAEEGVVADDKVDVRGDIHPHVPALGMMVTLCGLMARPELNGVRGRLEGFNEEAGRWECVLDGGGAVNVKPSNFEIPTQSGVSEKRAGPDGVDLRRVRPRAAGHGVDTPIAGPGAPRAVLPRAARGKPKKLFGIW